jgi:hypothetical protein
MPKLQKYSEYGLLDEAWFDTLVDTVNEDCITSVSGTFQLQTNTDEQTLLEIQPGTKIIRIYNLYLDLNAITQNTTIKVYSKIDGSNYREIPAMTITNISPPQSKGIALKEIVFDKDLKITIKSATAEGATRDIPYRYFKGEYT